MLTVAHRLDAVVRSDWLLVLRDGKLIEQGPPLSLLLASPDDTMVSADTYFAQLARDSGTAETLLKLAR